MTYAPLLKTLAPIVALLLLGGGVYLLQKNSLPLSSTHSSASKTPNTIPKNAPPNSQNRAEAKQEGPDMKTLIGTQGSIVYYFVSTRISSGGLSTPRNIELNIIRSFDTQTKQAQDVDFLPIELSYTKFIDENTWQPHGQAQIKDGYIYANIYSAQSYIRFNQERLPIQINKIPLLKK